MPHKLSNLKVSELRESSKYIRPYRMSFNQDGQPRTWDGILAHDSVSILLYHPEKKSLIFVKQFRPVVYYTKLRQLGVIPSVADGTVESVQTDLPSGEIGETLELCAGLIDGVQTNPKSYAVQEVLEECGFKISEESLKLVNSFYTSVGLTGSKMTLYYAEVNEHQRIANAGGGLHTEGEYIEVIEWPISRIDELYHQNNNNNDCTKLSISVTLLYAVCWFKENILSTLSIPLTA
uniref:Uridine diphosphate glucose pyrophosphatase NUDT14 n=1 Tax=Trichobilharzia regenti TaxID=157069 RepID=A0AA85JH24_TRIRE|nr:unnamed protein product [Trichobilharzia regenti]